jgi:hypothetical protein
MRRGNRVEIALTSALSRCGRAQRDKALVSASVETAFDFETYIGMELFPFPTI